MRDGLLKAALSYRPWLLGVIGIGLLATIAVWAFELTKLPPAATESQPTPTLPVAVVAPTFEVTPVATAEPSPFAGIAEPAAQPTRRTGPIKHTVSAGEVLWQIAEQYALRPETVLWASDITNPDLLLIGQELLIPPADGVLYTVRPGDRLSDVANRYGVELESVVSSNRLEDANQIVAGVDVFLPGGRPLAVAAPTDAAVYANADPADEQSVALLGPPVALPPNIDALLAAGWLRTQQPTELYKTADPGSSRLHQLPGGTPLERVDGLRGRRIQVREAGDGRTRQAMTGWVDAIDLDVGRAPATRELPQAYPLDTAMDISHVFAPYRSQLDGSPYAEANCGPTAVGMALEAFGVSVPLRDLRAATLDAQRMYGNGVGTLITGLAQTVQQHGLSAMDLRESAGGIRKWTLDDIRAHIQQGHPVITQVRYRSLPGRGRAYYFGDHYILITGVVGDGFLYNDPIDIDGLGWDRAISGATLQVAMNASDQRYAYAAVAVGR
jgi:LysM repeat protein